MGHYWAPTPLWTWHQEGVNYSVLQGDGGSQLVAGSNVREFGFSLLVAECWQGSCRSLTPSSLGPPD